MQSVPALLQSLIFLSILSTAAANPFLTAVAAINNWVTTALNILYSISFTLLRAFAPGPLENVIQWGARKLVFSFARCLTVQYNAHQLRGWLYLTDVACDSSTALSCIIASIAFYLYTRHRSQFTRVSVFAYSLYITYDVLLRQTRWIAILCLVLTLPAFIQPVFVFYTNVFGAATLPNISALLHVYSLWVPRHAFVILYAEVTSLSWVLLWVSLVVWAKSSLNGANGEHTGLDDLADRIDGRHPAQVNARNRRKNDHKRADGARRGNQFGPPAVPEVAAPPPPEEPKEEIEFEFRTIGYRRTAVDYVGTIATWARGLVQLILTIIGAIHTFLRSIVVFLRDNPPVALFEFNPDNYALGVGNADIFGEPLDPGLDGYVGALDALMINTDAAYQHLCDLLRGANAYLVNVISGPNIGIELDNPVAAVDPDVLAGPRRVVLTPIVHTVHGDRRRNVNNVDWVGYTHTFRETVCINVLKYLQRKYPRSEVTEHTDAILLRDVASNKRFETVDFHALLCTVLFYRQSLERQKRHSHNTRRPTDGLPYR